MTIQLTGVEGKILSAKVTGQLKSAELAQLQKRAAQAIDKLGKVRMLVVVEDFQGWEKGGEGWGNISFQANYDDKIEKIALVGDQKWKDMALHFTGQGLRPVAIEFFEASKLAEAKAWLAK